MPSNLQRITVAQLLPLLLLCRLDPDQFPAIRRSLEGAYPTLITATLDDVEQRILQELTFQQTFGTAQSPDGSARRARSGPAPAPSPAPTHPAAYPPRAPSYATIQQYIEDHPDVCIGCWQRMPVSSVCSQRMGVQIQS